MEQEQENNVAIVIYQNGGVQITGALIGIGEMLDAAQQIIAHARSFKVGNNGDPQPLGGEDVVEGTEE